MDFPWLKGHGTENDFLLLPDHDGRVHEELDAAFVAALCDRRRGLGADGVLRVVRTSALGLPSPGGAEWFMDYRNADGSVSEMCGNGIRVFARHLLDEGLVAADGPWLVATRDGDKTITVDGDLITVDMGVPEVGGVTEVAAAGRRWEAREVHTGNPHAVAVVDDLSDPGALLEQPAFDVDVYPEGVNIEFIVPRGERHIGMRVHERGSGETRSCGTGACAAAVSHATDRALTEPWTVRVDLPGGTVAVGRTIDGSVTLTGPAVIVARGRMEWLA